MPAWDWEAPVVNADIEKRVTELAEADIDKAYQIKDKIERQEAIADIRDRVH